MATAAQIGTGTCRAASMVGMCGWPFDVQNYSLATVRHLRGVVTKQTVGISTRPNTNKHDARVAVRWQSVQHVSGAQASVATLIGNTRGSVCLPFANDFDCSSKPASTAATVPAIRLPYVWANITLHRVALGFREACANTKFSRAQSGRKDANT